MIDARAAGILLAQSVVAGAFGCLVLLAYRWVRHQSTALGAIFAVTVLLRIAVGTALFWISYLRLPIAESLYAGGGYWKVAVDGIGYFIMAQEAADAGRLFSMDHSVAAPLFVNTLTVWLMAVGAVPSSAVFLNLCLYTLVVLLIVRCFRPVNDWRCDLPCIASVAAYSFSPVILLHSTQPMKDELSSAVLAGACMSILPVSRLINSVSWREWRRALPWAMVATAASAFAAAGIRWYLAVLFFCAVGVLLAAYLVPRWSSVGRHVVASLCVLFGIGVGFWGGAGHYFTMVLTPPAVLEARAVGKPMEEMAGSLAENSVDVTLALFQRVAAARTGFLTSGGNTNLVVAVRETPPRSAPAPYAKAAGPAPAPPPAATTSPAAGPARLQQLDDPEIVRAIPRTVPEHLTAVGLGLAIMLVPISLVQKIFDIRISGGHGLLPISDLDTLFLDMTIVVVLMLLWKRRRIIGDRLPVVLFGLLLAGTTAVLLGYVVTNFGTVWRMRTLMAIPLWITVVALSPVAERAHERAGVPAALT